MNPLLDIDEQEIDIYDHEDLSKPMNVLAADFVVSLRRQKYPIQRVTLEEDIIEIKPNTVLDTVNACNLAWLQTPELPEYAHALAKQKPLNYVKLGSTGPGAESYERRLVKADEKTWTQFCDGLSFSTSVKFLEFNSVRLVKISEPKWKQFCESIAKNASLTKIAFLQTRLDMLSKSRLEALCLALKSNRTLETLNLQGNYLGTLNEPKFDIVFSYLFSAQAELTALDIRDNELADLPDNLWVKYCNYLATNTHYKTLKLSNGRGRGLAQWNKRAMELEKALTKNAYLKALCYDGSGSSYTGSEESILEAFKNDCENLIEKSPVHKMQLNDLNYSGSKVELNEIVWKKLCEAISKNQYLTAFQISPLPAERKPEINKMIQTKTKDRHSKTFAFAHCLHKLRFNNNPIHSALHKGVISNILTFFEVKPLYDQVESELKPFLAKAKLESNP